VEWFKLTKQRAAVRPEAPAETASPATVPAMKPDDVVDATLDTTLAATSKVSIANIPSPKTVFDNPASEKVNVRPAPRVGFTISSSKNGEKNELQLSSPTLTVAKARILAKSGWRVQITNAAGRQFAPSEFDDVLKFD
jgi:hypothetical protein